MDQSTADAITKIERQIADLERRLALVTAQAVRTGTRLDQIVSAVTKGFGQ